MLRYRPDIKPPMWGPMSAVQYAVRVNAEKLGLTPVCFVPFWEFGGATQVYDVFGGVVTPHPTNTEWDWSGLRSGGPGNLDTGIFVYPRTPASNQSASLIFGLRALESSFTFKDFISIGAGTSWRASISKPSNDYDFVSYGNTTGWSGSEIITIPAAETVPIALSLDRAASSKRLYVAGKTASSSHTPTDENLNAIRLFNRLGDNNRTTRGTALYFGLFDSPLTQAQATRFEYEPYTLLMPVVRPVYFDLGASAPAVDGPAIITAESTLALLGQKGAVGPANISASASIGMGGVKQASAHLNIVGTASVLASGQKSTSGPVTITSASAVGAAGVKTIAGLDKEGPAVIAASATAGMGGVKCAVSQAWIGADSGLVAAGVKGGVGSVAWLTTGEFWAGKAPDVTEITTAEVARIVRATPRMKTVTASPRVKQVSYEISRA